MLSLNKKLFSLIALAVVLFLSLNASAPQKRAIIIDPLNHDSEFKSSAIEILHQSGYSIEYISSNNVTIHLLSDLPENYDLYVFRVHSTCINNRTWIFSGEKYQTNRYPILQLSDLIHKARPSYDSDYFFAVSPEFLQYYNQDSFKNGVVLMMGCAGLCSIDLAEAFCGEGASIYVSWDDNVSLEHTDKTFLSLLDSYCLNKTTIIEAITYAFEQNGVDPIYGSNLDYYTRNH